MSPIRTSPTIPIRGMVAAARRAAGDAARRRHGAFRAVQPRGHDGRRRQPATNVIPAPGARASSTSASTTCGPPETLADEIRAPARRGGAGRGCAGRVDFEPTNVDAFLTEPGPFVDLVVDAVERVTGRRPALSTTGGTSDARFIKDYCPVLEFGLVGQTMHQVDERVAVADIETLARVYEGVIERYFA